MCSDTDTSALNGTSLTTLHSYMRELDAQSPTGNIWAMWVSQCRKWAATAREVYRGALVTLAGPGTLADVLNCDLQGHGLAKKG